MSTMTTTPSQDEASASTLVGALVAVDRVVADSRPRPSASFRRDKPRLSCNSCRRRK